MSKKSDAPVDARTQMLRDLVKRKPGGKFAKGNTNAAGRRTANAEKMAILRNTPANCTTKEMSDKFWLTIFVMALGNLEAEILPVEWAAKLVADKLWGNRHKISNDERMLKLEAELERIYRDNPNLAPSLEERIGPMKTLTVVG